MAQRLPYSPRLAANAVPQSGAPRRAAADALRPWLTSPAWLSLAVVLMFSCAFPALATKWQFWPFVVGMVVLGLPHGALDHLAPLFLLHKHLTPQYLVLFVAGYMALVALYLVFWHVFPLAALAVFLLCSWLHWGQGDAYYLTVFGGQPRPPTAAGRFLIWAVRGGLPIVLPPLAHPAAFAQVAGGILSWYGTQMDWTLSPIARETGLAVIGITLAVYLWQSWRLPPRPNSGEPESKEGETEGAASSAPTAFTPYGSPELGRGGIYSAFWRDAGEVALLLAYFLVVPAILAVGVYFCVWHSARHIARLMVIDDADRTPLSQGQIGRCVLRSAVQALPMTLGALGFLALLWVWQGEAQIVVSSFVFLYLSLIAALTFPHFLLVLWMDREEFGENRSYPVVIGGRGD